MKINFEFQLWTNTQKLVIVNKFCISFFFSSAADIIWYMTSEDYAVFLLR